MEYEYISFYTLLVVIFYCYFKTYRALVDRQYWPKEKRQFKSPVNKFLTSLMAPILFYFPIYFAYNGLSKIEKSEIQIEMVIFTTLLMWALSHLFKHVDSTSNFTSIVSQNQGNYSFGKRREFKKVSEVDSRKISTYPRFTIFDITGIEAIANHPLDMAGKIVFDSSDFEVINQTFGAFEGLQHNFAKGLVFNYNEAKYITEKVRVDFLNIFDDYHMGNTENYSGKKTPYNLQIIVTVKQVASIKHE